MQVQFTRSGLVGTDVFPLIIPSLVEDKKQQKLRTDIKICNKESAKPGEI